MRFSGRRFGAWLLVSVLFLGGCTAVTNAFEAGDGPQPITLVFEPKSKTNGFAPGNPVTVRAHNGTLDKVSLVGANGTRVDGRYTSGKTAWRATEPLGFGRTYTLTATGTGEDGRTQRKRSKIRTAAANQLVSVWAAVSDGATVGVGMPISLQFSAPIQHKRAAERAIRIKTSKKTVGAFHWFSDSWVVWRPKSYWKPGTKVVIDAGIYGKHFGGGMYGSEDFTRGMRIGKKVVAVADGKTHKMTVAVNGKKVRTLPLAMGRPTHPTPHGTYTVMSEHRPYTMDSSTYGVPTDAEEGYKIEVTHAARLSWSGIFYHSAPWSVWAQGNTNVSHGCINLAPQDADWLMKLSKPGDIVEVRRSGGPELDATDGWSFWQLSWQEWKTGGVR